MSNENVRIPNDDSISPSDIHTEADLEDADLSDADLRNTDLSNADLRGAKLSDADLKEADLSDALLRKAKLTRANLTGADLTAAQLSEASLVQARLIDCELSRADLQRADLTGSTMPGVNLFNTDLADTTFYDADLSNANLNEAILTSSDLARVNLADAEIQYAKLNGVTFTGANLSDTDFEGSDLSKADLSGVTLDGTKLDGCDLKGANLRRVTFQDVSVDGFTSCEIQDEGYDVYRPVTIPLIRRVIKNLPRWLPGIKNSDLDSRQWDQTAQSYHKFKRILKSHGLVGKARRHHLRERGARRCEARTAGDRLRWLKSALVWQLTGYGVSIRRIFRNMVFVFAASTFIYLWVVTQTTADPFSGDYGSVTEFLYYSTVTFTTTPPSMPTGDFLRGVVMAEAFLGTLLIVFLGYVLGTREQF